MYPEIANMISELLNKQLWELGKVSEDWRREKHYLLKNTEEQLGNKLKSALDFQRDFGEKSQSGWKCPKNSKEIRNKVVKH